MDERGNYRLNNITIAIDYNYPYLTVSDVHETCMNLIKINKINPIVYVFNAYSYL